MQLVRLTLDRLEAEGRAVLGGLRSGVSMGRGVRLGRGVRIAAARGACVILGDRVEVGSGTQIVAQNGRIEIGNDVFIAGLCIIAAADGITIGPETMIAEMVCVRDHDHDPDAPPRSGRVVSTPVSVGARVWLASKSSIVRGGQVGDDSVIGAHAVVNRPIGSGVVAVGVPARVVRERSRRP